MSWRTRIRSADMAGEPSKATHKVPPVDFGTVGRYFGTFGYQAGFKPTVELLEVDEAITPPLQQSVPRRAKLRGLLGEPRDPWTCTFLFSEVT